MGSREEPMKHPNEIVGAEGMRPQELLHEPDTRGAAHRGDEALGQSE